MSTYTVTQTGPRELAGKVASDLRQFSLHYGEPALAAIPHYMEEIEALLRNGYMATYSFGYRRSGMWVIAYHYTVTRGQLTGGRPGGIDPSIDVGGATYLNYLTYSDAWSLLSWAEQGAFRAPLAIQRVGMQEPSYAGGTWAVDRTYGAGGTELQRKVFKR